MLKIKRLGVSEWNREKTRHCILLVPFLFCLCTRRFHPLSNMKEHRSTGKSKCFFPEARKREARPDTGRNVWQNGLLVLGGTGTSLQFTSTYSFCKQVPRKHYKSTLWKWVPLQHYTAGINFKLKISVQEQYLL